MKKTHLALSTEYFALKEITILSIITKFAKT